MASRRAAAAGLAGPTVVLSFDCDTDQDIDVVEAVDDRVRDLGLRPSYAVPGELLARGAAAYRRVRASGAEFINHGDKQHCEIRAADGAYLSSFFYDQLPRATVAEDIARGHARHGEIFGAAPEGFRVPHFGTFSAPGELAFLYEQLLDLGYRFSSSTLPVVGARRGPHRARPSLWEFPVSGGFQRPLAILDSWGYRHAPDRSAEEGDYLAEVRALADWFAAEKPPYLLNIYADPSQVAEWPEFFAAMKLLAPWAVDGFRGLLATLEARP